MSLDDPQSKTLETLGRDMADVRVTLATLVAEVKAAAHAAELREKANSDATAMRDKSHADAIQSVRDEHSKDMVEVHAKLADHQRSIRQHDKFMWVVAGASIVSGGIAGAVAKLAIGG